MSSLNPLTAVTKTIPYANDEDIAIKAAGDYAVLVPADQKMGYGDDGVFAEGSPWILTSASYDPLLAGVLPGMAVKLTKPIAHFKSPGDLLIVDAVHSGQMTLRRKGMGSSIGMPPGIPAGLTGVEFTVLSVYPQILRASYELDRRYGTDDLILGRRHVDQYDPRQLRDACVLGVLQMLYTGMARGSSNTDQWMEKAMQIQKEREAFLAYASVTWTNSVAGDDRSDPFVTRIMRG